MDQTLRCLICENYTENYIENYTENSTLKRAFEQI